MIIIDLIGQPCSGKSRLMGKLFTKLKDKGYNVEIAPEYAKELVYESNQWILDNQFFVFSEQLKRIRRLENKVDIIISDTSLLLTILYSKEKNPHFNNLVLWEYNNLPHMTYYLKTNLPYKKEGRYQDEASAKEIDLKVKNFVESNNIQCKEVENIHALKMIMGDIKLKMNKILC